MEGVEAEAGAAARRGEGSLKLQVHRCGGRRSRCVGGIHRLNHRARPQCGDFKKEK